MGGVQVNQKAIADYMSVSIATVSKALRGQPDISPMMREKVVRVAHEMGYNLKRTKTNRGNGTKRSPRKRKLAKGQFVGVLTRRHDGCDVTHTGPTYLGGMCRITNRLNVSLVIHEWPYSADPLAILKEGNQPPAMRDGALTGLAMGGDWPTSVVNSLKQKYQIVLYPHLTIGAQVDVIGLDNISAMLHLVQRLKALGHTRIGFVGRCGSLAWASERFAGYVAALDRLGLEYEPQWVIRVDEAPLLCEGHKQVWREHVDRVEAIRKEDDVHAWICSSNWPAFQLYRGMSDRGYRIPDDLSITGFDDSEPVTLGCPQVTTVRIPREKMGQAVFKRLVYRINNPKSSIRQSIFCGEIIDHGTIGPVPAHKTMAQVHATSATA